MPDITALITQAIDKLAQPAVKLFETVARGTGILYEPTRTRRQAQAEADADVIRAKAKIEIDDLYARAARRREALEHRRQKNIESIISQSLLQLPDTVSGDPVDEDWTFQFFNFCQDVGNEEMQMLWAKLLAGEVAKPGSFSLRTLQLVQLLQKSDAATFERFCNYLWEEENEGFFQVVDNPISSDSISKVLQSLGLSFNDCLSLESLGLIQMPQFLITEFDTEKPILRYGSYTCIGPKAVSSRVLTHVGKELVTLCDRKPDEAYLRVVLESWKSAGIIVQEVDVS